jgi:uncharacterized protein YkwD
MQQWGARGDRAHMRLRRNMAGGLALLAIAAVLAPAATARTAHGTPAAQRSRTQSALQSGILQGLNQLRAAHHLHPLTLSHTLSAASLAHTKEMADRGYFAHDSGDGSPFWKRIQHFYGASGYGYWSVGENLLWSTPEVDSPGAIKLWWNSPEHKKNMLDPRWREIGIAALHVGTAPGVYGDQQVTIVTTDFGVRR